MKLLTKGDAKHMQGLKQQATQWLDHLVTLVIYQVTLVA